MKDSIMKSTRSKSVLRSLYTFLFLLIAIIWLLPIIFQIMTSFKSLEETYLPVQTVFPKKWTIRPYIDALHFMNLRRYYLNSLIVASVVTASVVLFSSLAGYSFAKHKFLGKNILFILILSTMMIPFQVTMIPLYIIITKLKLHNTYWGLILPNLVTAFGIFMMKQFISTIPDDLVEAARIDGLKEFGIFFKIIVPMILGPLATLAIFTFLWNWESFLWPIIVIDAEKYRTLPIGMIFFQQFAGGYGIRYPHLMAISVMGMFPVMLVFLALQKYFVEAIVMTGLKG